MTSRGLLTVAYLDSGSVRVHCREEEVQVCFLSELMAALTRRGDSLLLSIPPIVVSSSMSLRMDSSRCPLPFEKSFVLIAPS